ncbi:hypothetical protein A5320_07955 [Rheinheimera sp. SA_1]|nr:hypothetical protein A5320_07955 [Rheinheimera sp. SA_1]
MHRFAQLTCIKLLIAPFAGLFLWSLQAILAAACFINHGERRQQPRIFKDAAIHFPDFTLGCAARLR